MRLPTKDELIGALAMALSAGMLILVAWALSEPCRPNTPTLMIGDAILVAGCKPHEGGWTYAIQHQQ
jgi:hypothetical protein